MSFFKIKPIWKGNSKHKKLSEDAALQTEDGNRAIIDHPTDVTELDNELVTFKLKYLGSTVVEKNDDKTNISSDAVKNMIKTAKAARKQQKKLQRVIIAISPQGIVVTDLEGNDMFKASIYRISNCASDSTHRQVFSFISTDDNNVMECHAFFCSKRKLADTVTLTVGKIFTSVYEAWRDSSVVIEQEKPTEQISPKVNNNEEKLIDFDCEGIEEDDWEFDMLCTNRTSSSTNNSQWVSFEDDFAKPPAAPPRNNLILV